MTRETKIGLLVGLAFIIVIGILLSDHLTSTTEPASAALGVVGANSREGLTTIGRPSVPVTVEPPPAVVPRTPVVTVEEIREPANVNAVIKLAPITPYGQQPAAQAIAPVPPVSPVAKNDPLAQLAQKLPADLELIDQAPPAAVPATGTIITNTQPTEGFTEYTVKEGDSLGRIASRLMGSSNKANQDAIVKANPSMKGDPNRIIVGRNYRIPIVGVVVASTAAPAATATVEPKKPAETKTADTNTYWYKVKENDNLWKIASDQLGNGNAWTAIKELNKDVLKGGESLHPNMRLRLPAKPVNSATASIRD
jgi:nucleoid-associated protein YgaU